MHLCELTNGRFSCFVELLGVIGKQFGAAGLKDVCIEAFLIGIDSVDRAMRGKQHNKGARGLKIIYEALQ